jgi:transmembrane sensor
MNAQGLSVAQVERLQQAADWFLRLKEAPADEVITEWMDWCESDPQNLTAFEEIKSVWAATDEPIPLQPLSDRLRRFASPIGLAAGVAILATAVILMLYRHVAGPPAQVLSTPPAMHSDSVLEDGSRLALGAQSRVSTRFSESQRLIVVESGEAFFDVAKDTSRPFVVKAGSVAVTAIGTAFNVRRGAERVVVTVTEGRVGVVAERRQPVQVEAGQQISYSHAEHRLAVAPVDSTLATSWQQGVFKYVREPLTDVIADLNRYRTRRIVVADETLGQERYTGTVFGNRMDDWLEALQSAFAVRVVETPDAVVLMRDAAPPP